MSDYILSGGYGWQGDLAVLNSYFLITNPRCPLPMCALPTRPERVGTWAIGDPVTCPFRNGLGMRLALGPRADGEVGRRKERPMLCPARSAQSSIRIDSFPHLFYSSNIQRKYNNHTSSSLANSRRQKATPQRNVVTSLHCLASSPPDPIHHLIRMRQERTMSRTDALDLDLSAQGPDTVRHAALRRGRDGIVVLAEQVPCRNLLPRRGRRLGAQRRKGVRLDLRVPLQLLVLRETAVEDVGR